MWSFGATPPNYAHTHLGHLIYSIDNLGRLSPYVKPSETESLALLSCLVSHASDQLMLSVLLGFGFSIFQEKIMHRLTFW